MTDDYFVTAINFHSQNSSSFNERGHVYHKGPVIDGHTIVYCEYLVFIFLIHFQQYNYHLQNNFFDKHLISVCHGNNILCHKINIFMVFCFVM